MTSTTKQLVEVDSMHINMPQVIDKNSPLTLLGETALVILALD
jgi:hypothetical protein